ncbi:peptidoglycan recognition protein [Streptomyces sp. NPDC052693]|uniref:peptidoglycan recognition protein family protein n=1 Tax=unclassified Streptomyces TaxID=2593676 RepID=UPI003443FA0A
MVPPGGTAHIADGPDRADSGTMRVYRGRRGARGRRAAGTPGTAGVPRAARVALGCLPGTAAAVALVLCAHGVENAAETPARAAPARSAATPYAAPRPPIVPRSHWLGDAARDQPRPRYDDRVAAVFVHHTDSPNGYDCADAPRIIRALYTGQTGSRDWDDIGYNFVVDRCGTIYEGRAGGVERAVTGAHTQGFNHRTTGIAALGTFTAGLPVPRAVIRSIAALSAWKLGLTGTDPRADVRLVSSNGLSRYAAGTTAELPALAGHNDGYMTSCPGAALHARLPEIRQLAARLQGRPAEARQDGGERAAPSLPGPLPPSPGGAPRGRGGRAAPAADQPLKRSHNRG